MEKLLGKIESAFFGLKESRLGLHLTFSFNGSGAQLSNAAWSPTQIECTSHSKWTEDDRDQRMLTVIKDIDFWLNQAKVADVSQLGGIPVEVTLEDGMLRDWRILTEVL